MFDVGRLIVGNYTDGGLHLVTIKPLLEDARLVVHGGVLKPILIYMVVCNRADRGLTKVD